MNVQAVVSADRQFVKLRLVPYFTSITDVTTFTFSGAQSTEVTTGSVLDDLLDIVDGSADDSDEELLTSTTGITVRTQEGRSESGVPFLSNIPYVNRLFKNVGIGHETSHLMLMVTPRIIIQKEIEEDAIGGRSN